MLKVIYSQIHKRHNPAFEVYEGEKASYPEVPERIEAIARELRRSNSMNFMKVKTFPLNILNTIHHPNYVKMLKKRSDVVLKGKQKFASYFIRDTYAPLTKGTYQAAKEAVDCALTGADFLKNGEKLVYSLCRPPGHHAERIAMGGYCYFNNAAAAAEYLSAFGKVAILDIDYHHGNGTQNIFYDRSDILYVSLHVDPNKKYPYISGFRDEIGIEKGRGFNKNYPLPLGTGEKRYRQALAQAIQDIRNFSPRFLILSAGFDTYYQDPIGGFKLKIPSYCHIGEDIATLELPTLVVQEGGYMVKDLGKMAVSLMNGLQSSNAYGLYR